MLIFVQKIDGNKWSH